MNKINKDNSPQDTNQRPIYRNGVDNWFDYIHAVNVWKSWGIHSGKDCAYSILYTSFGSYVVMDILNTDNTDNDTQDSGTATVTISDHDEYR